MTPLVSVLIPVYNGERHVGAAIESVLAQTFADFELLLVDDASLDGSVAVIESFADARIRLLRNDANAGQIVSLNRGLAEARGAYVARLDQDDRCLPTRLERQVAVLEAEPRVALVAAWVDVVDDEGNRLGRLEGRLDDYADFLVACLVGPLPIAHPAVTLRRELALGLGGYDDGFALAEDRDLWRRMALAGHEARVVQEPLVRYRSHAGSQSQLRAAVQEESESRSVERFVRELSGRVAAGTLAQLLRDDPAFWGDPPSARAAAADLDVLLADASARLALAPEQREKLAHSLRRHVGRVALRSWRAGATGRTRAPLLRFASADAPGRAAVLLVAAFAPLLRLLHATKWRALDAVARPGRLEGAKRLARRSHPLVRGYARLRGRR